VSTAPSPTIGRPGDPAAVRSLTFDDVLATYVVDGVLTMYPAVFFPDIPNDYWSARPELCTPSGDLLMSAGGLLIERDGSRVLIDAGVGTLTREYPFGRIDCGSMVDALGALGVRPEDIDVVAFTHLHFDHAGWAYANRAKTFPNARYVLAAREWAPYARGEHGADITTPWHVVVQLACEGGAVELIGDGDEIAPGVRALVTGGHTPGHTSYVITSRTGRRLVVLGDAFHSPVQLAHPDWLSAADSDAPAVESARRRLLAELAEPDTLGFGFHFGDQPFGRVVSSGGTADAIWDPVPTAILAPPPR
jgi:glyoxylase-like metal-dependent hydrolase (beta-lactamase superfamily II)